MIEKSIDQKLKECKTVTIQNVERSMQNNMIYSYLKQEKIDNDIQKHILNTTGRFIILEFKDHEKAKAFYDRANFKDKIILRPFNIYFNVQLTENQMKKYHFEGINQENARKMFEMARKVGVCKIYTNYTNASSSGKLKPNGILSFIRKQAITQQQYNKLKEELQTIGIKLSHYSPQKGLKCAVILTDFYSGDLNQNQQTIQKNSKQQATALIKSVIKDFSVVSNVTSVCKRKQVPNAENKQGSKKVTKVKAIVEFQDSQKALNSFQQIRKGFISMPKARAVLHFYSSQTNSYVSLFTSGIEKKEQFKELSDKQFEDKLVEAFRKVNKDVIQVNIYPSKNNSFIARVYLRNDQQGRNFIVDYENFRDSLIKFYKNENNIRFNINVDDKTMKKIKQYEKRTSYIMANIKNQADKHKLFNQKGYNVPINNINMMPHLPLPMGGIMAMPQAKPNFMGMNPQMGGQPNYPMQVPFMAPPIGGSMPPNMQIPGALKPQTNEIRDKIAKLYNNKAQLIDSSKSDQDMEESIRKQAVPLVKLVLETDLKIPPAESYSQIQKIIQNNDIGTILQFLNKPKEYYSKVLKI